jgi:hypothetical protein
MSTTHTLYLPSIYSVITYIRALLEKLTVGHLHNKFHVSTKKISLSCWHNSLLRCTKFILKKPTNAFWFYKCNFITKWLPICFGHSCDHIQGGNTRNTNIFIMYRDHSTVRIHIVLLKFPIKWKNGDQSKILDAVWFCGVMYIEVHMVEHGPSCSQCILFHRLPIWSTVHHMYFLCTVNHWTTLHTTIFNC